MFTFIGHLYTAHPYGSTLISAYVFVTAVGTMPTPDTSSGKFYKWAFGFLNGLAAGLPRVAATMAPTSLIAKALNVAQDPTKP